MATNGEYNDISIPQITGLSFSPFYHADGIANLRDLGGYAISPTTSLRRNFLYRSAHLSRVTPEGAKTLVDQLGVTTIYDFRSNAEVIRSPSCNVPGATRLHVPIFKDQDASPNGLSLRYRDYISQDGPMGFMRAYTAILVNGATAYRTIFEHIRDRPTEPLLFHCTGGKDRTGVFAALVLRVAGVLDDEVIGREYELTEIGLGPLRQEFITSLLKHPELKDDPEGVARMLTAKAAAIKASLTWVDRTYGGVEGYMKTAMGFSDEDIGKIRKNLIVEENAIYIGG
jgi:protein tyrosine/serine phosphatase